MDRQIPKNLISELEALGVGLVYLFGSQVHGAIHFDSDVDIGVVFIDVKKLENASERLELYTRLYNIFSDLIPHEQIDIVLLQTASLSLQFQVIQSHHVLHEISPAFRADYQENILRYYLDFKSLLGVQNRAALERIK